MVAECNYGGGVQRWLRNATMEAECYVECGRPGRTLKSVQIVNYHLEKIKIERDGRKREDAVALGADQSDAE